MVNLYFSAGRGTETFVAEELKNKLNAAQVEIQDGRVLCKLEERKDIAASIGQLRTVERAFVLVSTVATQSMSYLVPAVIISILKRRLFPKDLLLEAYREYQDIHQETNQEPLLVEPPTKKMRSDPTWRLLNSSPSFRMSVRCSGRVGGRFNSQMVASCLGRELASALGWRVNLRYPDLELCLHMGDERFTAGIPLFRGPLSKRSFIADHGLRSTVAAIIVGLASVQPGERVLDPMCGKATILLEGASMEPAATYLGIDVDDLQLGVAASNIRHAGLPGVMLLQADGLHLPLPPYSVDKIVCDAPFGQKFKTSVTLEEFYTRLLQQWARVLKPSGIAVLLTSAALKDLVARITTQSDSSNEQGQESRTTDNVSSGQGDVNSDFPCQPPKRNACTSSSNEAEREKPLLCDSMSKTLPLRSFSGYSSKSESVGGRMSDGSCLTLENSVRRNDESPRSDAAVIDSQEDFEESKVDLTCSRHVSQCGKPVTSSSNTHRCASPLGTGSWKTDSSLSDTHSQGTKKTHAASSTGVTGTISSSDETDVTTSSADAKNAPSPVSVTHPVSSEGETVAGADCADHGVCSEGIKPSLPSAPTDLHSSGDRIACVGGVQQKLGETGGTGSEIGQRHNNDCEAFFVQALCITEQHYVKLGETHAYLIVMKCKSKQIKENDQ